MGWEQDNRADTRKAWDNVNLVIWDVCKQGKDCKGICSRYNDSRPYLKPYSTHFYCSRCGTGNGVWARIELLVDGLKCPCCNHRPRRK